MNDKTAMSNTQKKEKHSLLLIVRLQGLEPWTP